MKRFISVILLLQTVVFPALSQPKIADMASPTLSSEPAILEGLVSKAKASDTDSVRIYVFDLIAKDGYTAYALIDSTGYFRFEILTGTTNAVSFFHGQQEALLLVEPGETVSVTLDEGKKDVLTRWQFGGAHSEWNNGMNRLPKNQRYNSLYNEVIGNWKQYTEDEDEFRFKEIVAPKQAELEQRIQASDAPDEVRTFNYLASKLYYMELLSGYAMTLNQKYLQRGMDRSVSRAFYSDAVKSDYMHYNALLYTPMGKRLKNLAAICNEQRGGHFTYPAFLDTIDYARKGMLYLADERLLNDRQLAAIKRKTPALDSLIVSRNEALRLKKREQLRNPMYYIKYIDDDLTGRHVFDAIRDQYPGRIFLLDFWATWCMPCRMAMENMKPLKEKYKDRIEFVYLTGETSSEDTWRQLIPSIKGDHFFITDRQWKDICKQLKVSSIPAYMVIDWDGLIVKQFSGFPGNEALEKVFEKVLKEKEEKEAKERAEKEAKERAEKEAKERAEQEAKVRAEQEKAAQGNAEEKETNN